MGHSRRTDIPMDAKKESMEFFSFLKNNGMHTSVQFSHSIVSNYLWPHGLCCTLGFPVHTHMGFPGGVMIKNLPTNVVGIRDLGSICESGISPRKENGNALQYSCLENSMDREAWWAIVLGVTKNRTWLSTYTHLSVCVYTWVIFQWVM